MTNLFLFPLIMLLFLFVFVGFMIWYQIRSAMLFGKLSALSIYISEARAAGRTSDVLKGRQSGLELLAKADPVFRATYGRIFMAKFSDNLSDVLE